MLRLRVALLLPLLALLLALASAVSLVDCPVDCDATPDVAAEIDACLAAQATLCNTEVRVIPKADWEAVLGITDPTIVNGTYPDPLTYLPTNESAPRVNCTGLVQFDHDGPNYLYICIETIYCYIDPDAEVTSQLNGTCAAAALGTPGVASTYYLGPATFLGGNLPLVPGVSGPVYFEEIIWNGGGTTDPLLAYCSLTTNLTLNNVNISGFLGPFVLNADVGALDVGVTLINVQMNDIPGTPIYLEGLFHWINYNFYCARCATTPGSECVHLLMSDASYAVFDDVNSNCFRVADLLPPRCRYCLTGDDGFCGSRCDEGLIEVYDRRATELIGACPLIDFAFIDYWSMTPMLVPEFDPLCRVWSTPTCNFVRVVDSYNFTRVFPFAGGDIVWEFDAPLLCAPGGDISPVPGPFFLTEFSASLGDEVPIVPLPPLPTPPEFVDPSFEEYGTVWVEQATLTAAVDPNVLDDDLPARTGDWLMRCDNNALKSVSQPVQADAGDVGNARTLRFYGRRKQGQRYRYAGRFMRLLIDGVEQDRIEEPVFSDTLVNDGPYYAFTLDWTPADAAAHTLTLECDFRGGADAVTLMVDDAGWLAPWAGAALVDPSFEPHSLTWADTPLGAAILDEADTPCPARTGTHVLHCGVENLARLATQQVTFTEVGVYAVHFYAQRRNSIGNYVGLEIDIVDAPNILSVNTLSTMPIDVDHLPSQDDYYGVFGEGGIVITSAPTVLDLGFYCDFGAAPGGAANLCIDDVSVVPIGTIGVAPSLLGFSSQQISSMPYIANQTCSCDNITVPERNITELPCQYALDNETVCVEEVPSCCAMPLFAWSAALEPVLYADPGCSDLNAPSPCVFLVDCDYSLGDVRNCHEYTCTYNASAPALPAASIPDAYNYLRANCTRNQPIADWTDSLLYPAGPVADGGGGVVLYAPVPQAGVVDFAQVPIYFYQNCPYADDPACFLYGNCDQTIDYDPLTQAYSIYNCDLLNCTAPSGLAPTTRTQLEACAVVSGGNTLTSVEGAWVLREINSAARILEPQLLAFYQAYIDNCESLDPVPVFQLDAAAAALAGACEAPAYFKQCPCCAAGTYTVPAGQVNANPAVLDDFYTCTDGAASCRCNDAAVQASNPPPEGGITYHIVVAPDTLRTFRFLNARAQQHMYGMVLEQLSYELVLGNSIVKENFFDDRAVCRLMIRQDNEFVRGSPGAGGADCVQGNVRGVYSTECNIQNIAGPGPARECDWVYGQLQLITSELQFECLVDERATEELPGFGSTIFNSISEALAGCSKDVIGVRATTDSSYYEEDLEIDKANRKILLVTLPDEQAIVVGRHTIGTNADNVTVVGFRLVHPADNQQPLFKIEKEGDESDLNDLNILNCVLDGSGCRKCGVVDTKRLDNMLLNYTFVTNWQFFSVKIDDVKRIVIGHTTFNATLGRSILIKYREGFVLDQLPLIDVRGGEDLKGAAMVSLTAKTDTACDGSDERHRCLFRGVTQIVRTTDDVPRFRDICFLFVRGAWNQSGTLYDNTCRLAQDGMVFLKTDAIGAANIVEIFRANPGVRPTLFQLQDEPDANPKTFGNDVVMRGTTSVVSEGGDTLFTYDDNVEADYDMAPYTLPDALRCESNINWDPRYGFGAGYSLPRHGVLRFHNVSSALEFCWDRRKVAPMLRPDLQPSDAFIVYVRTFNGSKFIADELTVLRNASIIGDGTDACNDVPAGIQLPDESRASNGHRLLTRRLNITDVAFYMPPINPPPVDLWSSGPLDYDDEQLENDKPFDQTLPSEVVLLRVIADGRDVLPASAMWAFNLLMGYESAAQFFEAGTNKPPEPTYTLLVVNDTVVRRFPSFNSDTAPDGFNFVPGEYPYINGLRAQSYNRLSATSVARLHNLTVHDVDSVGLDLRFFNNYTIQDSRFFNCSGRALDNDACVRIWGNDVSQLVEDTKRFNATEYFFATPSQLWFLNNTCLHTTDVLFPQDGRFSQPGWVACFQLMGFPITADYCVINGSTAGLPISIREDETLNTTINQCSLYDEPAPIVWPDLARYLRGQCIAGHLEAFSGTKHDLAFGHKNTDQFGETYFCDSLDDYSCCPLFDPDRCYVVQNAELLTPENPWLGQYVFASLNDAIVNCNATTRWIVVVGSDDPFRLGDVSNKVYAEVISATVPLVSVRGIDGPLEITCGAGVTWVGVGHSLDTQCVPTRVSEFVFRHDGTPGAAIWDQTLSADAACGLTLDHNYFNMYEDGWAIRALVGDYFDVVRNAVRGRGVTRRGIEVYGNGSCSDVGVRVHKNDVTDVLGVGIDMHDLNCPQCYDNSLRDVGGQDLLTQIPYAVRFGFCAAPVPLTQECAVFDNNYVRSEQMVDAVVGEMATCWLEPVPLDQKRFRMKENDCRGLEFGVRFNQIPVPAGDKGDLLRAFCQDNPQTKGLRILPFNRRFDWVRGPPADDFSLITDPEAPANKYRWCTDCCPFIKFQLLYAVFGLLGLGALLFLGICIATSGLRRRSLGAPHFMAVYVRGAAGRASQLWRGAPFPEASQTGQFPQLSGDVPDEASPLLGGAPIGNELRSRRHGPVSQLVLNA